MDVFMSAFFCIFFEKKKGGVLHFFCEVIDIVQIWMQVVVGAGVYIIMVE